MKVSGTALGDPPTGRYVWELGFLVVEHLREGAYEGRASEAMESSDPSLPGGIAPKPTRQSMTKPTRMVFTLDVDMAIR